MRDQYVKLKKKIGADSATLARSPRGAPTVLGDQDEAVQKYIRQVRLKGGVVNVRTVLAAAEGIMTKNSRHKLKKYGGHIGIEKSLGRSILRRMGYVKRKGTKATKSLVNDFDDIQKEFVDKVNNVVREHNVPDSLFIDWDQTGCQMVPGGEWTIDERGSTQVTIAGLYDKRQITVLLLLKMVPYYRLK